MLHHTVNSYFAIMLYILRHKLPEALFDIAYNFYSLMLSEISV
jgi:hypothetical protein